LRWRNTDTDADTDHHTDACHNADADHHADACDYTDADHHTDACNYTNTDHYADASAEVAYAEATADAAPTANASLIDG
jgi:hypothetical protein